MKTKHIAALHVFVIVFLDTLLSPILYPQQQPPPPQPPTFTFTPSLALSDAERARLSLVAREFPSFSFFELSEANPAPRLPLCCGWFQEDLSVLEATKNPSSLATLCALFKQREASAFNQNILRLGESLLCTAKRPPALHLHGPMGPAPLPYRSPERAEKRAPLTKAQVAGDTAALIYTIAEKVLEEQTPEDYVRIAKVALELSGKDHATAGASVLDLTAGRGKSLLSICSLPEIFKHCQGLNSTNGQDIPIPQHPQDIVLITHPYLSPYITDLLAKAAVERSGTNTIIATLSPISTYIGGRLTPILTLKQQQLLKTKPVYFYRVLAPYET
jgi:hypothetical protein